MVHDSSHNSSEPPIDLDHGKVRLGLKSLFSLAIAIVTVTVGGVITWTRMATKDDVVLAVNANNDRLFGVLASKSDVGTIKDASSKVDAVKEQLIDAKNEVRYIRARIDFLMEQSLYEARRSPAARAAAAVAASKVRTEAKERGEKNDPLSGLDDL